MNETMEKVIITFNQKQLWDDIDMTHGEDNQGYHYMVFEDGKDIEKFVQFVKQELELDEDTGEYDVEKLLETEFVYSDEYSTCDDCSAIVRTSPNSYHWQPDFYVGDGFLVCSKCFNENTDYQEDYLRDRINNPKNAINGLLSEEQLEELGFEKLQGQYESGWHPGQTDKPELIFDKIKDDYDEIVFLIDEVSQFYITFSVWIRE
jgi:hypothetical protein